MTLGSFGHSASSKLAPNSTDDVSKPHGQPGVDIWPLPRPLALIAERSIPLVYLLHFNRPYKHARHYLGSTNNLNARLERHRAGNGARLIEVITQAGIGFTLARTWEGGRTLERRLKNWHNSPKLCPICRHNVAVTQ